MIHNRFQWLYQINDLTLGSREGEGGEKTLFPPDMQISVVSTLLLPFYVLVQTQLSKTETVRKWAEVKAKSCLKSAVVSWCPSPGAWDGTLQRQGVGWWEWSGKAEGKSGSFSFGLDANTQHFPSTWRVRDGGGNLRTRKADPQTDPHGLDRTPGLWRAKYCVSLEGQKRLDLWKSPCLILPLKCPRIGSLRSAKGKQRKRHQRKLVCLCLSLGVKGQKQVVTLLRMKHREGDSWGCGEAGGSGSLSLWGLPLELTLESRCCL